MTTSPAGELDYTNPNGVPDRYLDEREARLWLLSQLERGRGDRVAFNEETQRWERAGIAADACLICGICSESFQGRAGALFCSEKCRQKASRKQAFAKRYSGSQIDAEAPVGTPAVGYRPT